VSEATVTNPVGTDSSEGSERKRTAGEIQDTLTDMLREDYAPPQEEEEQSESGIEDGLEEQAIEDESYEDSVEVDEMDEEGDGEYSESDAATYRIIVDGKETQVPLDELISGYQKGSSFTQKSQALSEERKNFETTAQAVQQERQSYATVLQQLRQQMEAAAQPNIDWDTLERQDPVQWLKLKQMERDRQGQIQAVQEEQVRMQQLLQGQQSEELEKRLSQERTMVLEKIPEWSDSDLQADEQRKLLEYGKTLGFSDEELGQIYDHRALIALRDAWRYNKLTNGEKVQAAKSKIGSAKAGNKETSQRVRSRKQKAMRQKLRTTGKVDDAAALFGELLAD